MEDVFKINIGNDKVTSLMTDGSNKEPYHNEYWEAYYGDNLVHFKNKTFNNCWLKYNYAHKYNNFNIVDCGKKDNLILPNIIDLDNYISTILWRCKIKNTNYWETIRPWYNRNIIPLTLLQNGIFNTSNCGGKITINLDEKINSSPHTYMVARDAFKGTIITEIEFNLLNGCAFSVGQNMFRGAGRVKNIILNGRSIGAYDISGMFEFCGELKSYPNRLIDWSIRTGNHMSIYCTNIAYAFEACGLIEIPSFNLQDRFADNNTIIAYNFAEQAFNAASNLIKIGPVLDCILIDPLKGNSARIMFNCFNLQDARIKNLNHGDWYLDGKGIGNQNNGNLSNLNKESIEYLFANLYDLNKYDPALQDTDDTNPHRDRASLYCPKSWEINITRQMLDNARLKNWSIYIDGILRN